jgi:hypothetical protein
VAKSQSIVVLSTKTKSRSQKYRAKGLHATKQAYDGRLVKATSIDRARRQRNAVHCIRVATPRSQYELASSQNERARARTSCRRMRPTARRRRRRYCPLSTGRRSTSSENIIEGIGKKYNSYSTKRSENTNDTARQHDATAPLRIANLAVYSFGRRDGLPCEKTEIESILRYTLSRSSDLR